MSVAKLVLEIIRPMSSEYNSEKNGFKVKDIEKINEIDQKLLLHIIVHYK